MASFQPTQNPAELSWDNLDSYITSWRDARESGQKPRPLDVIADCNCGSQLSSERLTVAYENQLDSLGVTHTRSWPFQAEPRFLMHHLMITATAGLAIDIPKHLLAGVDPFDLDVTDFALSSSGIDEVSDAIANAVFDYHSKSAF